jgi:molybdopterin-guanine dinucleotide biosynthesis protein A
VRPAEPRLGAIVLAGGRSSRMGAEKALLEWHGSTMLRRVTGILQRVAEPVVVVHAEGQTLPDLPEVERVADARAGRGPVEGIAAGMRAVQGRCEAVFVSATDVPMLHPDFVRGLAAALDGHDVAVPVADGREHPLEAVYRLSLLPRVERLLFDGQLRAMALLDGPRVRRLEGDELAEARSLRNVNTPGQYRDALAEPEPEVVVELHGELRRRLGFARTTVRAATLGRALEAAHASGEPAAGTAATLNGAPLAADPTTPLVEADVIALGAWLNA